MTPDKPSRVLVVCTANICRSAFADVWLTQRLAELGVDDVEVRSAGTHAAPGLPMAEDTASILEEHGLAAGAFRSSVLRPEDLTAADVVLTATRDHRAVAARLRPAALRRLFTMRQMARLLEQAQGAGAPPARSHAGRVADMVAVAASVRGVTPSGGDEDDVADPWGEKIAFHRATGAQLAASLESVARALTLGSRPPTG